MAVAVAVAEGPISAWAWAGDSAWAWTSAWAAVLMPPPRREAKEGPTSMSILPMAILPMSILPMSILPMSILPMSILPMPMAAAERTDWRGDCPWQAPGGGVAGRVPPPLLRPPRLGLGLGLRRPRPRPQQQQQEARAAGRGTAPPASCLGSRASAGRCGCWPLPWGSFGALVVVVVVDGQSVGPGRRRGEGNNKSNSAKSNQQPTQPQTNTTYE